MLHWGPSLNNNIKIIIIRMRAPPDVEATRGTSIYLINIRCLLANLTELCFNLEVYQPHVICIQETWLDDTVKESIFLDSMFVLDVIVLPPVIVEAS